MHSNSISHPFPHSHTEWLTIAIALVHFKNAYFVCLKKVPSGIQTSSAFNIRNWSSHCLAFAKILKIFANICRPSRQPRFPSSSCTTSISTSRQTSASTMFWQGQAFWWEGPFKAPFLCPSVMTVAWCAPSEHLLNLGWKLTFTRQFASLVIY